jgi:hypothetical protein
MANNEGFPYYDPGAGPINPGDDWVFPLAYNYVGGVATWDLADPSYSPVKPTDPPTWTLMADFVCYGDPSRGANPNGWLVDKNAHKNRNGRPPAGANHLFNDAHVAWYGWNGGNNMRTNSYWVESYIWRRTVDAP